MPKKNLNKKKVKLNKKKFINTGRLELFLAKIPLNNVLRNFRRRKSSSPKPNQAKKSSITMPLFIRSFLSFRQGFFKKIIALGIVVGAVFIALSFIRQYNTIQYTPFLKSEQAEATNLNYFGPEYNVLISGFKKVTDNRFAEMILLVSLNSKTGNIKILTINPNFITTSPQFNKKYTLKTLINNVGSEDPVSVYTKSIENFLGVRIDRYIAYDVDDFQAFLKRWDFSMKAIDAFTSSTGFYNKDNTINKGALAEYLFTPDTKKGYDGLINRQLSFFTQIIENNRNVFVYLKAFWASKEFTDLFHTNMTKSEMSGFMSALMTSSLPARTTLIDSSLGIPSSTGTEEGLTPNYLEFDAKIKDIMLSIDIIREQANLEIYNASAVSGLASKIKRIFQNMGSNIVSTNNYPEKVQGIKLYVPNKDPERFTNNITAIENYFGADLEIIIGDYKYNYTGDLILVLGE